MPLIRYSQYITYPDGNPAATIPLAVWLLGGNVPVPLFSNKAGTLPLPNPTMTDADGLISVYAAPATLTAELAGQVFPLLVDDTETDPAWPGVYIHTQAAPAAVWTIDHHIGVQPAVTVLIGGQVSEGDVEHPTNEQTTITFGAPATGVAHLRG